jgi:hypothetical protein
LSFWSHRSRSTYCIAINSHTVHAHRKVLVLVALLVLEHAQSDNDDNENDRSSRNRHRRWVRTFPRFSRRSSNNIIIIIIIIMSATSLVDNPLCVSWTLRRRKKFLIVPWHGMACCCSRVGYAKMWKDLLMPVACTGRRTSILNKILVGIHP